jgi:hypothetical protein
LRIRASDFNEDTWDKGLVKIWSFRKTLHRKFPNKLYLGEFIVR